MKLHLSKIAPALLFFALSAGAQTSPQDAGIPNMALPSPQAGELTKFGNSPVDEFSGKISANIPIHNYVAGTIQVPIALSYSAAGVKVEQKPTWTGINWVLNAGGVINREVMDLPDEYPEPKIFMSFEQLELSQIPFLIMSNTNPPYVISQGTKIPDSLGVALAEHPDDADSEADRFSFTFPGYSGSFYLKPDAQGVMRAHLLKYEEELRIEILGSFTKLGHYEFKITTPDGTAYYFGGHVNDTPNSIYAIEETQFVSRVPAPVYGKRAKTAFYLTAIENVLGDKVFFEYETVPQYEIYTATNSELKTVLLRMVETFSGGENVCPLLNLNGPLVTNYLKNIVFNGQYLKNISNNRTDQQVSFDSFWVEKNLNSFPNGIQFRVLSSIDFGLGKANLDYIPKKQQLPTAPSTEKFFLEKVKLSSPQDAVGQAYTLEYNDAAAFPRNAVNNAQDYFGFYNGKTANQSLLPKNSEQYLIPYIDGQWTVPHTYLLNFPEYNAVLGDRTPVFSFASKATLTKIIYPTGGFTTFEYEPVRKDQYTYTNKNMVAYRNTNAYVQRDPVEMPVGSCGFECDPGLNLGGLQNTEAVYMSQPVTMNVSVKCYDRTKVNQRDLLYVKKVISSGITPTLTEMQNAEEKTWHFPDNTVENSSQHEFSTSFNFVINKTQHILFLVGFKSGVGGLLEVNNAPVEAEASFSYINGKDPNQGPGVRIKRVQDYADESGVPQNIRRFYYMPLFNNMEAHDDDDLSFASFKPLFHNIDIVSVPCGIVDNVYLVGTLSTNSFAQNIEGNVFVSYFPDVTVSLGGDHFEKGAIERKYRTFEDEKHKVFYSPNNLGHLEKAVQYFLSMHQSSKMNFGDFNGLPLYERIWANKGGQLEKINEKVFTYNIFAIDTMHNIAGIKMRSAESQLVPLNRYFGTYNTFSAKYNLKIVENHDYMPPVPLSAYTSPPFELYPGWRFDDHDSDGILNQDDPDFITPAQFADMSYPQIDGGFDQIQTTDETYYLPERALPDRTVRTEADGTENRTVFHYPIPESYSQLSGLGSPDAVAYDKLNATNQIGTPIQTEAYRDNELLATTRNLFTIEPDGENVLRSRLKYVLGSKGNNALETKVIYSSYDAWNNPTELYRIKGAHTAYKWSADHKPLVKAENATFAELMSAFGSVPAPDPNNPTPALTANAIGQSLPNAMVTIYAYDPVTRQITAIVDPKGDVLHYEYDAFHRLQAIRDRYGNLLSEYDYHYQTQN